MGSEASLIDVRGPTDFAHDTVVDNLRHFIQEILSREMSIGRTGWHAIDEGQDNKGYYRYNRDLSKWSADTVLQMTADYWWILDVPLTKKLQATAARPFTDRQLERLTTARQGWANDLYMLRNKWAHRDGYSTYDTLHFLFIASLLLEEIGAYEGAQLITKKRRELERQISDLNPAALDNSLIIHCICHKSEPEFDQFLDLMEKSFPTSVRGLDVNLERWLEETNREPSSPDHCKDLFLVAKVKRYNKIVACLYASYYPVCKYVFISYVGIDEDFIRELWLKGDVELHRAVVDRAVPSLLKEMSDYAPERRGVITEIGRDEKNAALKKRFRRYATNLFNCNLYEIPVDYYQPSIDALTLGNYVQQDLMYIPDLAYQTEIDRNKTRLTRQETYDILSFVYMRLYLDSFSEEPEGKDYQAELEYLLEQASEQLKDEWVPLRHVRF